WQKGFKVDDFYAARSRAIPPLPWSNIAPPFSDVRFPPSSAPELTVSKVPKSPRRLDDGTAANGPQRAGNVGLRRRQTFDLADWLLTAKIT
uniref:hypothetical protein n=1 Tax=Edaphosphingomonas laterariae TaxID=861865 RepID=UPI001C52C938